MDGQQHERDRAVRVLIVDDQQLMREGIASLLSIQDGIEVIGTAANGQEALERALLERPQVILMDVRMPVMDGVQATMKIRLQLPDCKILMLTTFDDEEYVFEALRVGASGYLLKDIPAHDLAQAVQAVQRGIYQLDAVVMSRVMTGLQASKTKITAPDPAGAAKEPSNHPAKSWSQTGLTEREIEVLRQIAQGATNREIAIRLVISEGTVKNHISNILSRLGLRDRTQAALYAREHSLL
ncbi:response regulator [Dictyobacter kobayashii]|uniref:DNA-binding response regulator n=1 Tax=Dictyobacter kobayashii TaxID=2014872 RepID=A0A402AZ20_9CHLR|nr:response regulator transcription factor [Dictyobacter kobayashii]GCE24323.1 DNA-binding response regulator [Dictyobacter kobayashii]